MVYAAAQPLFKKKPTGLKRHTIHYRQEALIKIAVPIKQHLFQKRSFLKQIYGKQEIRIRNPLKSVIKRIIIYLHYDSFLIHCFAGDDLYVGRVCPRQR